jgi:type II secretion system protein C
MAREKTTKKAAARITEKAEVRIVELSLQNPDLGAKRLVSLLKQNKISVSQSQIYSILKRHGLQTREKRLARIKEKTPQKATSKPAKPATKITGETEEQIVAASLQNPDFGAKRLVSLLEESDIAVSPSAVYAILKRHGLQNRPARLKKLKSKKAELAQAPKARAAAIAPEVEERIVEIALQNPDFGAKRLLPLLLESGIDVSSSKVYQILKHRGLQTRKLRQARLEDQRRAQETPPPEKAPAATDVTPEIEDRIVGLALQNPDQGPRRLAGLLAAEGIVIASSAIYSLLKRHGLQTRELRQSRIELERLTEADLSAEETEAPDAVLLPAVPEEPVPAATDTVDVPKRRPVAAPAAAVAVKSPRGARWLFYLADVALLVLFGYLGYLGYHAVINFEQTRSQPKAVAVVKPEMVRRSEHPQIAVEPIDGYRTIWERNLFNIPDKTASAPKPEVPIESIALAKKNIGLKLVGTVVANDAKYSRAIVHVSKTREQDAYREGDQAGKAKIKKILRNKVVITTDNGDQLLTIDDEDFGKGRKVASRQQRVPMGLTAPRPNAGQMRFDVSGSQFPRTIARSINLKQEEVAASLADTDQLLQKLTISPFMQDDQPAGFIISQIPRGSILTRMGLRNGYVVTQLNDQEITSPDQAAEFFRTLADGGEVSIQVRRSRGVRRRARQINLNIE